MLTEELATSIQIRSPYDQELLATLPYHTSNDLDTWLDESYELSRAAPLPKWKRIEILENASQSLRSKREEFALLIATEAGKPLKDARVEADRAADGLKEAAHVLAASKGKEVPLNYLKSSTNMEGHTVVEPIGLVVAISAFNHPLNLVVHQIAPAIAAGCPVIIKPSLDTPLSCNKLVDTLFECSLPEAYCRVAILDNANAEKLVTDSRVAFLSFIGSAKVGWSLRSKIAAGTRCALEHGGAAPAIIAADADLDHAAKRLVKGGFYHAGQVCVSTQRIYVDKLCCADFIERFTHNMTKLVTGDPRLENTDVGPLIRTQEVDRIQDWVKNAMDSGGELLIGGKRLSSSLFEPTAILNPSPDCLLSCQEVFGPVVAVYDYDSLDDAINEANSLPWAFQASIFTDSLDTANRVTSKLDASTVMVNEHTAFRIDSMPFSGRRSSGLGHGGIESSFKEMTQEKLIVHFT